MIGRARHSSIPPLLAQDGTLLTNDSDKATILNEHFASQSYLNIDASRLPQTHINRVIPILDNITINAREVLALLNSPDPISLAALTIYQANF